MKYLLYGLMLLFFLNCTKKESLSDDYLSDLKAYQAEKMDSRKKGYLQLVALSKLNDSLNVFGKHASNTLALDIATLPDTIGVFEYHDTILNFKAVQNGIKTNKDSIITMLDLTFDEYGSSEQLVYDRLKWQIITRANSHYLRVWDIENPEIAAFKGFTHFEPTNDFIIEGDFTYFDTAKTEEVKSKLEVQASTQFIGQVGFDFKDDSYTLDVGSTGFLMVADATNDSETYGGGRYIYLDLPKTDGKVTLDFNKLYNPPCSYSAYTTCLFPPHQNRLPFKITAGETMERIQ